MVARRTLLLAALFSVALAAGALGAEASDRSWTQTRSDVAPDPNVRFGQLANGLRYAIERNDTPKHEVSVRLRIGSGSLEERDDQQGLAHFLEHMAFKGSTHVPAGEMIKLLERHGLAFGPDTNAETEFTQTVFMLDLPENDPASVDLGLMLMRETASELTLSQGAMDPERGVVLSEERLRDTPDYEAETKRLAFELKGQLAPDRFPIGKTDILKTAPVSRIRAYYAANYRPDRATVIVVGDVDPAAIEAKIKAQFADWTPVGPEAPDPNLGVVAKRGPETQLIVQPGAHDLISIAWVKPFDPAPETEAKDRHDLVEDIAVAVLNRRLEREARSGAPPFISAQAGVDDVIRSARIAGLSITPKPGQWRQALQAALNTERVSVRDGVRQAEVDQEVAELRTRFQTAAAGAQTRRTPDVAQEIVRAVDEDQVVTSPSQDLQRFEREVKGLTAGEVSLALKAAFTGEGPLLSLTSPTPIEGGEAAVEAAFAAARSDVLAADKTQTAAVWPYTNFGAPGAVVTRRTVSDLGVTFVTFANGVRLNIKPTAFRKDQVLVRVAFGSGRLGLSKSVPSEAWASEAMILGGLGKISLEDMEQVLASRLYSAQLTLGDDAFLLSGATRPSDLEIQLQVLAAYVSDPGFRPSAFARIKNAVASQLDQLNATPDGVLARDLGRLERAGDARWATPTQADVQAATLDGLKALLHPALSASPLEVDVAGDVDPEAVIKAAASTFGALARRPPPTAPPAAALQVGFHAPTAEPTRLTHTGRADQAVALEAWRTNGLLVDPQAARTVNIAAEVLEQRLIDKIRIKEGATYSPSVGSTPSDVFPTFGVVVASVETPPAKIPGFFTSVDDIVANLASAGPSEDELQRALRPRIETLRRAQQTNEYWLTWIEGAEADDRRLDVVRTTLPGYARITAADVKTALARYLGADRAWRLEVTAATKAPGVPATAP